MLLQYSKNSRYRIITQTFFPFGHTMPDLPSLHCAVVILGGTSQKCRQQRIQRQSLCVPKWLTVTITKET